jgi:nicotinate phosphoribosyltransferase
MIYDEDLPKPPAGDVIVDPADALHMRPIDPAWNSHEIVLPVMRGGRRVGPSPSLEEIRARAQTQLNGLHPAIRRLLNPHTYPVGLERGLHDRRTALVLERRLAQPAD